MTPRLGTDGNRIVYPVRGIVQGATGMGRQPSRRTLAYVSALVVTARLVAGALLGAGYGLELPLTVAALAVAAAVAERISVRFAVAKRGLTSTEEQSIHLLPTLYCGRVVRPTRRRRRWSGIDARRSRAHRPTRSRTCTEAEVGHVHQHTLHRRRRDGPRSSGHSRAVPSEFGELVAASLVGAVVGEVFDVLFAALTASVRGRPISDA